MSSSSNEPSKLSGNYNSIVGGLKEQVGSALGNQNLQTSGSEQKATGDAEYKAAQAEGYVEGTKDRVGGKVDNILGAVTGDKSKQLDGQARNVCLTGSCFIHFF
ncbi:putative Hmp1-mismatch base pair and cruciform DNA recognition protein [Melampsora americana]|nr:putative Hmp1-mismatch base pair and cruciform DNA recognition protein [Melampsora americana]